MDKNGNLEDIVPNQTLTKWKKPQKQGKPRIQLTQNSTKTNSKCSKLNKAQAKFNITLE